MNAAQTSHFSNYPSKRNDSQRGDQTLNQKLNASPTPAKSKTPKRAAKKRATKPPVSTNDILCCECLQQAEICREQAQEAARMKRFKAARGLFATAIALCQSALSACAARNKERAPRNSDETRSAIERGTEEKLSDDAILNADDAAIQAYLQQLNIEMATYSDLARSMERPLRS